MKAITVRQPLASLVAANALTEMGCGAGSPRL